MRSGRGRGWSAPPALNSTFSSCLCQYRPLDLAWRICHAGASAHIMILSAAPSLLVQDYTATACTQAAVGFGALPVPHYNHTQHTIIAHVHVAKMAGRSVIRDFQATSGLKFCSFQGNPWTTYLRKNQTVPILSSGCGAERRCIFTWEAEWKAFQEGCEQAMVTAAPGPVVKGAVPFFLTLIRSPLSWVFSAMAHYSKTGEDVVAADIQARKIGYSGWLGWYGFDFPLHALSGSNVPMGQRAVAALHNLQHSAFGLVSDLSASLLVILWQLGIPERAERFCISTSTSKESELPVGHNPFEKNSSYQIDIRFYSTAQYLVARMTPYECVYTKAASAFYQRLGMARQALCSNSELTKRPR